jgi:hypothetical protein
MAQADAGNSISIAHDPLITLTPVDLAAFDAFCHAAVSLLRQLARLARRPVLLPPPSMCTEL